MKCSFSTWIVARSFSLSLFLSPSPSYAHSNTRSFWHGVAKAFSFCTLYLSALNFPYSVGFSVFSFHIVRRSLPLFLIEHSALLVVTPLLSFSFSLFFTFAQFGFSCTHNNNRCHTSFFSMSRLLPVLFLIINDCEFSARCWLSQRPRS